MLESSILIKQIPHTLKQTRFSGLGERIQGKVRDSYIQGNQRILIATDRISAFDKVFATIPFKGEVLTRIAAFWFEKTKNLVPNHVNSYPDPNVLVAKEVEILPIEVIVRGYITGSAWRDYTAGKPISGISLPKGLRKNQAFDAPLLTPSTKAEQGFHDEPISREEILEQKLVDPNIYEQTEKIALALFELGTAHARKQGMILVDTKYEFGLLDGQVVLADEVHTPDSSRYWYAKSYDEKFAQDLDPDHLDKEFVRKWLMDRGWMGDGEPPKIDDNLKVQIAQRYITTYEEITGEPFPGTLGSVEPRIEENLKKSGHLT